MTKYKAYLKAHGIKLQLDYEAVYCNGIDEIATGVLFDGIGVYVHHKTRGYFYAVCNRSGDCSYFNDYDFNAYIEDSRCDADYICWLHEMNCDESYAVYSTMLQMYQDDEKVRIAFKHVKAGIMDELVFYRWISDRYQKLTRVSAHS